MIAAREFTSATEMQAAAAAVRSQFFKPAAKPKSRPAAPFAEKPKIVWIKPDADWHVIQFRAGTKMDRPDITPQEFVRCWCIVNGYRLQDIRNHIKTRDLVSARKDLCLALKGQFNRISAVKIGEILNRDHTSILHLLGRTGLGKGTTLSASDIYEIRRQYDSDVFLKDTASQFSISVSSVYRIGRRMRWGSLPERRAGA